MSVDASVSKEYDEAVKEWLLEDRQCLCGRIIKNVYFARNDILGSACVKKFNGGTIVYPTIRKKFWTCSSRNISRLYKMGRR